MHWHDFAPWEKVAIVILGFWYTVGWFIAIHLPEPALFMGAPVLLIISLLALLWLVTKTLTAISWLLRALGR